MKNESVMTNTLYMLQVDHSIIESFSQGGRTCITSRVYPTRAINNDAQLFVFNNATDANIAATIHVWQMNISAAFRHTTISCLQTLIIFVVFMIL